MARKLKDRETPQQVRARKRQTTLVNKFSNPKSHPYIESGLKTCMECGRSNLDKIHTPPHAFKRNYSSTLNRCMCGYARQHPIHQARI